MYTTCHDETKENIIVLIFDQLWYVIIYSSYLKFNILFSFNIRIVLYKFSFILYFSLYNYQSVISYKYNTLNPQIYYLLPFLRCITDIFMKYIRFKIKKVIFSIFTSLNI